MQANRWIGWKTFILGAAAVLLVGWGGGNRAEAAHDGAVSLDLHFGRPGYSAPAYQQRWMPGHYENREVRVLVEPERMERRWVPAQYEIRRDRHGRTYQVLVQEGHYIQYCVPARYETRCVQTWVPGYYVRAPYSPPTHRSWFDLGAFFHF